MLRYRCTEVKSTSQRGCPVNPAGSLRGALCGHCCPEAHSCVLQTCLDEFNTDVDCHRLIFPDALHNISSGLFKHMLELTENALGNSGQLEEVKQRCEQLPSFVELHLPAKRLSAKDITAAQRHSLGACMPVCLVALHEMELHIAAWTGMLAGQCVQAACTHRPTWHLKPADQHNHTVLFVRAHSTVCRRISACLGTLCMLFRPLSVWGFRQNQALKALCAISQHWGLAEQSHALMQLCWSGWICETCGSILRPAWTPFMRPG